MISLLLIYLLNYFISLSSLCIECPTSYYYNKGIQLKEEIDFSTDCSLKATSDIIYTKDFYLTNRSCDELSYKNDCIGNAENPMDDFWKIIKRIYNEDEAQKYQIQNIKIFLVGSPHFILHDETLFFNYGSSILKLFKEFNGSIEILPAPCNDKNLIADCFEEMSNNVVDVYLKIDFFQLVISSELSIKNIRFFGNDIPVMDFSCLIQKVVCCHDNFYNKKEQLIINIENVEKKSMFLFQNKIENENSQLIFKNVYFQNFYAIKEEIGWRCLIYSLNAFKTIIFENVTILDFFFTHGIIYDSNFKPKLNQELNYISMKNFYLGNFNSIPFQFKQNSSVQNIGFFTFENSFSLLFNITNLSISRINVLFFHPIQYLFIFEQILSSNLNINDSKFENNFGLNFYHVSGSLDIIIYDFHFQNFTNYENKSFFVLLNQSNAYFKHGKFLWASISNAFLFYGQLNNYFILDTLEIMNLIGNMGNFSNLKVCFSDVIFENIKSDYLLLSFNSNLTIINLKLNSSFFNQIAFQVDARNFVANKSCFINIKASKLFFFQSKYLDTSFRTSLFFNFITILFLNGNPIFLNIENTLLDSLIFSNIDLFNCSELILIIVKTNFFTIDLFNVSINKMVYSSNFLIYIEQANLVNWLSPENTFVNITNATIQNCVFRNKILSFQMTSNIMILSINYIYANFSNANNFFELLSSNTIGKFYKVNFFNITLTNLNGDISNPGYFYLIKSTKTPVDSITISNLNVYRCTAMQLIYLMSAYNFIILLNVSILFISQNNFYFIRVDQSYENNYRNLTGIDCTFCIKNSIIKSVKMAQNISHLIVVVTYNVPIFIKITNCYIEEIEAQTTIYFSSPTAAAKLISVEASYLEFYHIKQIRGFAYFLYFERSTLTTALLTNIFTHDSETFFIVSTAQLFDIVIISKITLVNIYFNKYYLLKISQNDSKMKGYSKVEISNISLFDIESNTEYLSTISSLFFISFDDLKMENISIKNMRNYKENFSGRIYIVRFMDIKILKIKNFNLTQNVWCNFHEGFSITTISFYLEIINCKFEISVESTLVRRFQALNVWNSSYINITNNEFIGMSTIERPKFRIEEMGVVALMTENSFNFPEFTNYSLTFENNSFKSNFGTRYGILGIVGFTYFFLRNVSFIDNEGYNGGGLAIISCRNVYLNELLTINSTTKIEGGGIYIRNSIKINILNSNFYNSSSKSDAGCISAKDVINLYFKNVSIEKSSTFDKGGTAYFMNIKNIIIDNTSISNSSAALGGIFFFGEKSNAVISFCHFKSGYSFVSGGFAMIQGNDMNITIISNLFFEFRSDQYAAIIYSYDISNLTIVYSNFSSSLTQNDGLGIMYLDGFSETKERYFYFYDVSFFNNSALNGANIYYYSNSKLNLTKVYSFFNQGSLFRLESNLFGFVFIQFTRIFFTNYLSPNWVRNSLILSSKCVIFFIDIQIINNKGTNHLFEIVQETNITLEDIIIINYYIIASKEIIISIFYVFYSTFTLSNCEINYSIKQDLSFRYIYFEIKNSIFASRNDSYQKVLLNELTSFLKCLESNVEIYNISISIINFSGNFFHAKKSNFSLNFIDIQFESMIQNKQMVYLFFFEGLDPDHTENRVKITNCNFLKIFVNVILTTNIKMFIIENSIFKAYNNGQQSVFNRAIELRNVIFLSINGSIFQNFFNDRGSCISIVSTLNKMIFINITKTDFSANTAYFSSVFYIRGSISIMMDHCIFSENKAIVSNLSLKNSGKGGCMIIDCEYYKNCFTLLTNIEFIHNYAKIMGPTILSKSLYNISMFNITFKNNIDSINFTTAFSSFPILNYILIGNLRSETFENVTYLSSENAIRTKRLIFEYGLKGNLTIASGQNFNFSVLITDVFSQQIISTSNIKFELTCTPFSRLENNARLMMINQGIAYSNNGMAIFEKVSVTYKPFSHLKCQINYEYPQDLLFESINPSENQVNRSVEIYMDIFVRECVQGELYQIDETCFVCPFGTYSINIPNKMDPSKKCFICSRNAYCHGGKYLSPLRGYWRINNQSNLIQKCLNDEACLGVGDSVENIKNYNLFINLTELQKTQGICGGAYEGNLCFYCRKGFARFKYNDSCQECDCPMIIYFKMGMSIICIVAYVSTQARIFGNIEKKDPHLALLTKIAVNHFQTMTMIDLIDLGWTYDFNFYFSLKNYFSFLSEDFFIIDCLIQQLNGNLLINKIMVTILLPLLLSLFLFFFWIFTFFFFFFKNKSINIRFYNFISERMRITFLIFMFILYPEILKKGFSLFNCIIIDEVANFKVLVRSPDIQCWAPQHTFWVLAISLPGIIFWGILSPIFLSIILKIYCKNINQILHLKEYNSFMQILESKKNKKFIVRKQMIINIEKELADKIFTISKPNKIMDIGYITKRQTFCERKVINKVEEEELKQKLNSNQTKKIIKIKIPASNKTNQKAPEILMFKNSQRIIKEPEELFNILEMDFNENLKITKNDLNSNKVLIQEKFNIDYKNKRELTEKHLIPFRMLQSQLEIPTKSIIILRNFGFLYKGYRKEYYFWEMIMFSRKFIFIFICVSTEAFPTQIKCYLFLAFLTLYIFLQFTYKPYQFDYLNKLEICSLVTAFFTSLIGLILLSPYMEKLSVLFVIILLGIHIFYLALWGRMFMQYGKLGNKLMKKLK